MPLDPALQAFADRIAGSLGHPPTAGQGRAIEAFVRLLASTKPRSTLVLKGYAGTGKTALLGSLVRTLVNERRSVFLLAPTGRAAKVLSAFAGHPASTIHRRIYRVGASADGRLQLALAPNRERGALFIVDEASMIGTGGGEGSFGGRDLLSDLFEHVFERPDNTLLLVGDPAQLPPVGEQLSPALDVGVLRDRHDLLAGGVELTEVVRQEALSGILANATHLRSQLGVKEPKLRFTPDGRDVFRIDGTELEDELSTAFARYGEDEVCLVCRSNKRAYEYARQVRARIQGLEEEVSAGDRLMIVRNNYFWAGQEGRPELMANGELVEVLRVQGQEERHGLRFADLEVRWNDGTTERDLSVKVILDVLAAPGAALPPELSEALYRSVLAGLADRPRHEQRTLARRDPWLNALQVKYGQAITGHKAQGGQWRAVFVDQGYLTEDMIDQDLVRWLYTAVTRATERLYLLNFHPRFFGEED